MVGSGRDLPAVKETSRDYERSPKIIEWEDLQQEIARLWSLSSAIKKAKETKESLAHELESKIEVRRESLLQLNELEEMRQKVEGRKFTMGDLLLHSKRTLECVRRQREQLCFDIRLLLVASKTLSAAHQQLQEANRLLAGERGHGHLQNLQKMVRARQQHMVTQVSTLYPVQASVGITAEEKIGSCSSGNKSRDCAESPSSNVSKSPQLSSLTIIGLQLTTLPQKKMSFFGDKKEVQMSATALGYVAHAVLLIASYLDVPLRYPLQFGGSHSYVRDYAPSIETTSSDLSSNLILGVPKATEFPLFLEGQDTTRAAYAIFLLNKDLEQLLNFIGAESVGPRHVLANLKELIRIIQSQGYIAE